MTQINIVCIFYSNYQNNRHPNTGFIWTPDHLPIGHFSTIWIPDSYGIWMVTVFLISSSKLVFQNFRSRTFDDQTTFDHLNTVLVHGLVVQYSGGSNTKHVGFWDGRWRSDFECRLDFEWSAIFLSLIILYIRKKLYLKQPGLKRPFWMFGFHMVNNLKSECQYHLKSKL